MPLLKSLKNFRPRLGMGWFMIFDNMYEFTEKFSSPSGDGLVHWIQSRTVPENSFFSSPSGVGLVRQKNGKNGENFELFSSPLGVELVPENYFAEKRRMTFSSPSGDALVLAKK